MIETNEDDQRIYRKRLKNKKKKVISLDKVYSYCLFEICIIF